MPQLHVADQHWTVPEHANLLDSLNQAGVAVPYSCRAGSCHACLVRCVEGEPADLKPEAVGRALREQGWRLACQCQVVEEPMLDRRKARAAGEHALLRRDLLGARGHSGEGLYGLVLEQVTRAEMNPGLARTADHLDRQDRVAAQALGTSPPTAAPCRMRKASRISGAK